MTPSRDADRTPSSGRNGYFVLHASVTRTEAGTELHGVMEDLTTGEKHSFDSAVEVSRLMSAWASGDFDDMTTRRVSARGDDS